MTQSCSPLSRASTSLRHGGSPDVDGRDKPGHDGAHPRCAYQNMSSWPFACFALGICVRRGANHGSALPKAVIPGRVNSRAKILFPHRFDARQCRHRSQHPWAGRDACRTGKWPAGRHPRHGFAGHLRRNRALHRLPGHGLADNAHRQARAFGCDAGHSRSGAGGVGADLELWRDPVAADRNAGDRCDLHPAGRCDGCADRPGS